MTLILPYCQHCCWWGATQPEKDHIAAKKGWWSATQSILQTLSWFMGEVQGTALLASQLSPSIWDISLSPKPDLPLYDLLYWPAHPHCPQTSRQLRGAAIPLELLAASGIKHPTTRSHPTSNRSPHTTTPLCPQFMGIHRPNSQLLQQ